MFEPEVAALARPHVTSRLFASGAAIAAKAERLARRWPAGESAVDSSQPNEDQSPPPVK
jgi:hypothetical protein